MIKKLLASMLVLSMLLFVFSGCKEKEGITPPESSIEEKSSREKSSREKSKRASKEESSEEESEEESKPKSSSIGKKPEVGPLSDEWSSFQIQIGKDVYQFPMTYAEFIAYGWNHLGDSETSLDAGRYVVAERFAFKDGLEAYAQIVNFDVNSKPFGECYISGIDLELSKLGDFNKAITLPKNVELGKTTLDEAIELYGTPNTDYHSDDGTRSSITYTKDYYSEIELTFNEEKVLSEVEIENAVKPDDFVAGDISDDIPKTTAAYKAPTAKSDNLDKFIIELAGDLYQIPAPVSAFLANGFKIEESDSASTVDGRGSAWVYLTKDNQTFRTIADNYSENGTSIENAFITSIEVSEYGAKLPMTIGKDITMGMTKAAFEKAISKYDFVKDDSSDYSTSYELDTENGGYEITVHKETNLVNSIEVENEPRYKDFAIT